MLENAGIGFEFHDGSADFGGSNFPYRVLGFATAVFLFVNDPVTVNFCSKMGAQGINTGYTNTVQAPRNFVRIFIEFTPGVENGHDYFQSRSFFFGMHIRWDTPAVVLNTNSVTLQNLNENLVAMTGQGFVNGIIHHLVDQVMQALDPDIPDVHGRPLAYGLKPFEDLDVFG
jgi:hypothetical protein